MKEERDEKRSGLELVLLRNTFYQDNYHRALFVLLMLIILNFLLVFAIIYKLTHPPTPQYFAITADGRMINIHPLDDPIVSDDYVLQWAVDATRNVFTLDFLHWQDQLQQASAKFTPYGWNNFLTALKQSRNLDTITNLKMVADAQITGNPQVIEKAVIDGVYAWKIEMPINVTYTNIQNQISMPMVVDLIVVRVPVEDNPDRIAINNFLPKLRQSAPVD